MKVCFSNGGHLSSRKILNWLKQQTPGDSGKWNNLVGVDNFDDADAIVVLHNSPLSIENNCSKKIIQLRREPDFIQKFTPSPKVDFSMDYCDGGYHASTWWVLQSFDALSNLEYPNKIKKSSAVISTKWPHRNKFFKEISSKNDGFIDFYGRKDPSPWVVEGNYKGSLDYNWICKYRGLAPYEYSIAMENSQQLNYFSEKIIDCFLSWTMPIYWGCPNISEYFPEDSYYQIDLNRPEDVQEILAIPIEKKQKEALRETRDLVMNKYNVWPTIDGLVGGAR